MNIKVRGNSKEDLRKSLTRQTESVENLRRTMDTYAALGEKAEGKGVEMSKRYES